MICFCFPSNFIDNGGELAGYVKKHRLRNFQKILSESHLRWLKRLSSTFQLQDVDLMAQLMLQSWHEKTAQSLVNTLVSFS